MFSIVSRQLHLLAFIVLLCIPALAQDIDAARDKFRELDSIHAIRYREHGSRSTKKPVYPQQIQTLAKSGSTTIIRPLSANSVLSPNLTVCYDTSGRFFLYNDTLTFYPDISILARDGKLLVAGEYADWRQPNHFGGFLLKCTDSGEVEWMKTYDTTANSTYNISWYYKLIELLDGSILMAGTTNDIATENDDLLLTRTNNTGDIIWNRAFKSRFWTTGNGSADYFWIKQITQDPSGGDIYLTAAHWARGPNISRFSLTDGSIVWSNLYNMTWDPNFHHPFGLDFRNNELIAFSKINSNVLAIWRLSKTTGDTIATKYLQIIDPSGFGNGFLTTQGVTRLNNGHYAIHGSLQRYFFWPTGSTEPVYHVGVVELDADFNFVRADAYRSDVESNGYNTRVTVFPDGSGFYSMLRYISSYTADVYYIQFREGQILKQRKRYYFGEGMPGENTATRMTDGGDMIIKLLGDSINSVNKIEFLNLHISDTSSNCLGITTTNNFSTPYQVEPLGYNTMIIERNDLSPSRNKTFVTPLIPLNFLPGCQQVSHCDTLSLVPSQDSFCVWNPVTISFRRNPACGATPFIRYDSSKVESFRILNDSTFQFIFKTPGNTVVHGSIFGCILIEDSINLSVFQSPGPLSIGPDSVICPGNTIRLIAKKGYKSYRWQDGSTDSAFTVTQPGDYWVVATDSCGNPFSDTMQIAPHPPIPFDIGEDIRICEKDTATISAPSSFFNYQWSPDYNIINRFAQSIRVFPQQDTTYQVRAEKTAGCFVYDSIRVFVNAAPPINLGPDQSFCSGDSLVLDAGAGFTQYNWNTGITTQQITVRSSGLYIVTGITTDNCRSIDSFQVLSIYSNPIVNLGNDSVLCTGASRLLDAGNFSSYTWNTGAGTKTISISQTGEYSVSVTDNNGCRGSGSILINKAVLPPASFLHGDTTICNYAKIVLGPTSSFSSYAWNTSNKTREITVSQPGLYWLEVKDRDNCSGRDTILIGNKDCLKGFFAPNAFTPNRDGKNDFFRPLIFGPLIKYELSIFNRWGQLIFHTTDYSKGWDGGRDPGTNGFAWVCSYQLQDEKMIVERGTVMIIR